ncbi:hypothetical protein ABPG74_002554 [Tetrahymena malaccensis]
MTSVYSLLNILLVLGLIGTAVSKKSIQRDFQMLFLKNQYQDNYLQILKLNYQQQIQKYEQQLNQNQSDFVIKDYQETGKKNEPKENQNQIQQSIFIQPNFNQQPSNQQEQSQIINKDEKISDTNTIQNENSKESPIEQKYTFFDEIKTENQEMTNIDQLQLKYQKKDQTNLVDSSFLMSSNRYSNNQKKEFYQQNTNQNSLLHSVFKNKNEQSNKQINNQKFQKESSLGNFVQKLKDLQSEVCQSKVQKITSKIRNLKENQGDYKPICDQNFTYTFCLKN